MSTGTRGRQTRRISLTPAHETPKKRAKRCPTGASVHGTQIVEGGAYVCEACHQEPRVSSQDHQTVWWRHLQGAEEVRRAGAWWKSAAKRRDSCVREGYTPSLGCLCCRSKCFHSQWTQWKNEQLGRGPKRCAICQLSPRKAHWRHPGRLRTHLIAWFSSGKASTDAFLRYGGELSVDSDICNRCHAEGNNNLKKGKISKAYYR